MEAANTESRVSKGLRAGGSSAGAPRGDHLARADDAIAAGCLGEALEHCKAALRTARAQDPEGERVAECRIRLADICAAIDRNSAALRLYGQGIAMLGRIPGGVSSLLAHAVGNTARLRLLNGETTKAAELAAAADALQRQLRVPDSPAIKLNLAIVEATAGRIDAAHQAFREARAAADRCRRTIGALGFAVHDNFARFCIRHDYRADAEMALRSCLILRQESAGPRHPRYAEGLVNLARLHLANDAADEAETLLWQAAEIFRHHAAVPSGLVEALHLLAGIAEQGGRRQEAESLCRELHGLAGKDLAVAAAAEAAALHAGARQRIDGTERMSVEPVLRRALNLVGELRGEFKLLGDELSEDLLQMLANLLADAGKGAEAQRLSTRAHELRRQPRWAVTGFVFAAV